MHLFFKIFVPIVLLVSISKGEQDPTFRAYRIKSFKFQGKEAKVVFPKKPNSERLWVWRARFWGHEPQTDIALLENGFHVVYVDVSGFYGNKEAVKIWNDFYDFIIQEYNLNKKAVLEAMSRGGLIAYNWAAENTDKVFCIYADAPVCDIKSWPGGLFSGKGSEQDWEECLKAYNLDEKSVLDFEGIPIYTSVKVAKANIPVLHVCGDSDKVVPFVENTAKLKEKFKANGGEIQIILKNGVGHHPHSLQNPEPIVTFILGHTSKRNL